MTRHSLRAFFCLMLLVVPLSVGAQGWSGILAPSRAIDWSKAGVVGGIPANRTQCVTSACRTVTSAGASSTAAQVQSAISSAHQNTYVLLPAGTYRLNAGLTWYAKNNVTLRGSGANQTFLVFTAYAGCQGLFAAICFQSSDTNYWGSPSNVGNWTANYSAGTTSIVLDNVTNLSVGWPLTLDQRDDLRQCRHWGYFCLLHPASGLFIKRRQRWRSPAGKEPATDCNGHKHQRPRTIYRRHFPWSLHAQLGSEQGSASLVANRPCLRGWSRRPEHRRHRCQSADEHRHVQLRWLLCKWNY